MSRVVQGIQVVLERECGLEGGTERGTRSTAAVFRPQLSVPPRTTYQYRLRRGLPLRVPPSTTRTPRGGGPEGNNVAHDQHAERQLVWPPPKPSRQPLWRDLSRPLPARSTKARPAQTEKAPDCSGASRRDRVRTAGLSSPFRRPFRPCRRPASPEQISFLEPRPPSLPW